MHAQMKSRLRAIEARLNAIDSGDSMCIITKPNLSLSFMVWDCNIRNVALGCCELDTVHAVVRYEDSRGNTRVLKGQAHIETPDGARTPCNMATAAAVLHGIEAAEGLSAEVFFDGELDVEKDFDLHLRFPQHGLVVKNVAKGQNVLTVIDLFQ